MREEAAEKDAEPSEEQPDYYKKGSSELATESSVTLAKLQQRLKLTKTKSRLVLVLVGLPGRGKSFIARKLRNFLTWRGSDCKIFNVGKYRREGAGGACDANFFDSNNAAASAMREKAAHLALEDMLAWLDEPLEDGDIFSTKDRVGVFDATNSTNERRNWVLKECTYGRKEGKKPVDVVFIESICNDGDLLRENLMTKVKTSPDYAGVPMEQAMADIEMRVKKYEDQYETIEDDSLSYIKIFNLSTKLLINHIYGYVSATIVPALMAWNIGTRPVYISRAGQSIGMAEEGIPCISLFKNSRTTMSVKKSDDLNEEGKDYRDALMKFIEDECSSFSNQRRKTMVSMKKVSPDGSDEPRLSCYIVTSTVPRAIQTVEWDDVPILSLSNLNPLDQGDFAGLEMEDIAAKDPAWYEDFTLDPFNTRFPGGECYADLMSRLQSVVVTAEQQVVPVLLVSHVNVIPALMAYFRNSPVEECSKIEQPLNTVFKYTPSKGGGWKETQHQII